MKCCVLCRYPSSPNHSLALLGENAKQHGWIYFCLSISYSPTRRCLRSCTSSGHDFLWAPWAVRRTSCHFAQSCAEQTSQVACQKGLVNSVGLDSPVGNKRMLVRAKFVSSLDRGAKRQKVGITEMSCGQWRAPGIRCFLLLHPEWEEIGQLRLYKACIARSEQLKVRQERGGAILGVLIHVL